MFFDRVAASMALAALWSCAPACTTITELGAEGSTGEAPTQGTTTGLLPTSTAAPGEASSAGSGSTTTTSTGSRDADPSADETGCDFVGCGPDVPQIETCDIWDDDCPRGDKCTFWANDGGASWNSTRCVPLDPDPAGPDEPCTTKNGVSGLDDCEAGAMCWDVDDTGAGTCIPFCVGSPEAPTCEDPARSCSISGGPLAVCIDQCYPLTDTCPEGEGCYPSDSSFSCAPDASGEAGGLFENCATTNACDPGSMCANPEDVEVCTEGSIGCCTPYCDLAAPVCPEETVCIAAFEEGALPPGYEDVGVCGAGAP